MKNLVLAIFLLINSPAFSSEITQKSVKEDFILAKINNKVITYSEALDRYRFVIAVAKIKTSSDQDKKILFNQILDKMIEEELVRQEALNLKIEVSPEEMSEAVDIMAEQQKKNASQFKLFFVKNNLSFESYLKQMESEILWSKIISEVLRSKIKITEVELKEFFEQRKFNIDVKKFLLAEILILNSENAEILSNKLYEELRQGADFNNIARQFSSSFASETNGEIGWVSQSDVDPKIYSAISKLQKDQYSKPVKLADGYHIFKLINARVETHIPEQHLNSARNTIFSNKLQNAAKGYAMDLRKKSFIEILRTY